MLSTTTLDLLIEESQAAAKLVTSIAEKLENSDLSVAEIQYWSKRAEELLNFQKEITEQIKLWNEQGKEWILAKAPAQDLLSELAN